MIRIPCPHCGQRNSTEFRYVGEATPRPDPNTATPQQWRAYLYGRSNAAGWVEETWYHTFGCRRFFALQRDTVSNETRSPAPPESTARGTEASVGDAVDTSAASPA